VGLVLVDALVSDCPAVWVNFNTRPENIEAGVGLTGLNGFIVSTPEFYKSERPFPPT